MFNELTNVEMELVEGGTTVTSVSIFDVVGAIDTIVDFGSGFAKGFNKGWNE